MRHGHLDPSDEAGRAAKLPHPARGSRWRWATSRRSIIGGSILAATLGLGGASAGAATTPTEMPTWSGPHGQPPGGMGRPTATGKVTALSGDTITMQTRGTSSETVTYSSSTTFRTMTGSSNAAALNVGDFIGVQGTTQSDGSVAATSIMFGTSAPGPMRSGGRHPDGPPPNGTASPAG